LIANTNTESQIKKHPNGTKAPLKDIKIIKPTGAFADAKQIYQVPHSDSDGDLETKLNRLMEQTNSLKKRN